MGEGDRLSAEARRAKAGEAVEGARCDVIRSNTTLNIVQFAKRRSQNDCAAGANATGV